MSKASRVGRTGGLPASKQYFTSVIYTQHHVPEGDDAAVEWCYLWAPLTSYHIFELEITEDGILHYQGYIEFKNQIRLSAIKKISKDIHVEPRRGTALEARDYCDKINHPEYDDGSYLSGPWEYGTMKLTPSECATRARAKKATDWTSAVDMAMTGNIYGIRGLPNGDGLLTRHLPNYKTMARDNPVIPEDLPGVCGYWFHGEPSTGKTYAARTRWGRSAWIKAHNKWWDSYRNEETVIINEFDHDHRWMSTNLKLWAEESAFSVEIKGSTTWIRPKRIVVCSNYTISELFCEDKRLVQALKTRYKEEEFTTPHERVHVDDL